MTKNVYLFDVNYMASSGARLSEKGTVYAEDEDHAHKVIITWVARISRDATDIQTEVHPCLNTPE